MKSAVFSCLGLGDGLIALTLSNNLKRNGWDVTTFHPSLGQLQRWFPHLPIRVFPQIEELQAYDRLFFFYEKSSWMQPLIHHSLTHLRAKTTILNPIATPNRDYPFWDEGKFDGNLTFVDNIATFCKAVLHLPFAEKSNGILSPQKCFPKRVIIHPTSSKEEKNWSKERFLHLAKELKLRGFEPVFTLGPQEIHAWPEVEAPLFKNLDELASFVAESGYFIGNDSGTGHLANCLGLPTITLCQSQRIGRFWRPGWSKGEILYPSSLIPNLKGMRLRDRFWREAISVNRVLRTFLKFGELSD